MGRNRKESRIGILNSERAKTALTASILFLAALVLRIGFIYDSQQLADFRTPTPGLDTCLHWEAAKQIRAGTPDPVFELMLPSAPLHPYFVALCQSVLGENIARHRLLRAFMGCVSVLLIFFMALRITNLRWAAATAAALVATLHTWIYFDTMVIKAVVDLFLLTIALALTILSVDFQKRWQMILLGLGLGLLFSLLRFSQGGSLIYCIAVAAYLLMRRAHPVSQRILATAIMLTLVITSQLGFKHRDRLFGIPKTHFLPVGGVHIRIGWQDNAIGSYHILRRFPALPLGHTFFARMCAEALYGRPLTPEEADQSYINEARNFIRNNPGQILPILGRKLALFFNNFEVSDNHYLAHVAKRVPLLDLPSPGYGGLVLLAFWGLVALWRGGQRDLALLLGGLVLVTLLSNFAAFVSSRYRLHATVPMAVLAAPGLAYLAQTARAHRLSRIATVTAITFGLGLCVYRTHAPWAREWIAFRPVLPNASAMMVDTAERNLKQSERAEADLKTLADLNAAPELTTEQMFRRSSLLHGLGRYTDSFHQLQRIVELTPDIVAANRQYLTDLMWYGDYGRAVDFLRDLMKKDPLAFRKVEASFDSASKFWLGADANLRLIEQALLRDIVAPRLKESLREERPVAP